MFFFATLRCKPNITLETELKGPNVRPPLRSSRSSRISGNCVQSGEIQRSGLFFLLERGNENNSFSRVESTPQPSRLQSDAVPQRPDYFL